MSYLLVCIYPLPLMHIYIKIHSLLYSDHVRKQDMNEKDVLIRANSLNTWFQSRSISPSLDRHLSSLRVETMSLQDILVIDSIRQSLIDKEQSRLNNI